jgi:hypothetical protein
MASAEASASAHRAPWRWCSASASHGFGLATRVQELQLPTQGLVSRILAFNVGVELGQLLVIVALVGVLSVLFKYTFAERAGTILLSALVAHTAWHWMTERGGELMLYNIQLTMPVFDMGLLAVAMRWGMLLLIIAAIVWLMSMVFPKMDQDGAAPLRARD